MFVSPCNFKCECTCAVSVFGGATPDVGGDRVRGRDRPVPCPGVYWPPRGGSAGRHWGAPGVGTWGCHGYRGGEETQGRGGLTQHLTDTMHNKEGAGSWAGFPTLTFLSLTSSKVLIGQIKTDDILSVSVCSLYFCIRS